MLFTFASMIGTATTGSVIPMTGILAAFADLLSTMRVIIIPAGILGMAVGGFMQTQAFHTQQAKETGRRVMVDSIIGIVIVAVGPAAVTLFGQMLGLP